MKAGNVEKLIAKFHDKIEYVRHIRNLKQALNHELALTKVHGIQSKIPAKIIHDYTYLT